MSELGASSLTCRICGCVNEAGAHYCAACRTRLTSAEGSSDAASWRRRARRRRLAFRVAAAALALLLAAWIAAENIGSARFLPAPASELTSVLTAGDWPTEGGSPRRAAAAPGPVAPLRGEIAWEADLGAPPGGGAVVLGGVVYAGATDGSVSAFRASDGALTWRRDLGAPVSATPSAAGGLLYVGTLDGRVTALRREDGEVAWSFRTGAPVRSSPAVADGVLYVGSDDRRLYTLDALTGEERWSFATEGRITSGPSVNERLVVVVSQDNFIHFIDRGTAKRWFDYDISLAVGSAAITEDSAYAADVGGTIRRIRWNNRQWPFEKSVRNIRQWMFRWGMAARLPPVKGLVWVTSQPRESFMGTPAVDEQHVYASTASGRVFAYDRRTGAVVWRAELGAPGATSPAVRGGEVIVGGSADLAVALDAATGEERWRVARGAGAAYDIAVGEDAAYIASLSGALVGIR